MSGGVGISQPQPLLELVQIADALVDELLSRARKVAVIDRVRDQHGPAGRFHHARMALG